MNSVRQNVLLNTIQYNSWFKKFHSLQNDIHNGNMQHNKSNRITNSFRENFFFHIKIVNQRTTPNIHPMKDIHHCQILNISSGFSTKYWKSYIKTWPSLHQIKTHRIRMINKVSKSFSSKFCRFGNLWKYFFFHTKSKKQ